MISCAALFGSTPFNGRPQGRELKQIRIRICDKMHPRLALYLPGLLFSGFRDRLSKCGFANVRISGGRGHYGVPGRLFYQ